MKTVIVKSGNRIQNYSAVQSGGKVMIEIRVDTANGEPGTRVDCCP